MKYENTIRGVLVALYGAAFKDGSIDKNQTTRRVDAAMVLIQDYIDDNIKILDIEEIVCDCGVVCQVGWTYCPECGRKIDDAD